MKENGQKLSKLCVAGLILPILSAVLFWGGIILSYIVDHSIASLVNYIFLISSFVLPVPGLILSIAGVNGAKKKGKRGSGAGAAGIVFSALEIVLAIFCLTFVNNYLRKAKTTPPDYTIATHTLSTETVDSDAIKPLTDNTSTTATT